jgi:hypothetical protein
VSVPTESVTRPTQTPGAARAIAASVPVTESVASRPTKGSKMSHLQTLIEHFRENKFRRIAWQPGNVDGLNLPLGESFADIRCSLPSPASFNTGNIND